MGKRIDLSPYKDEIIERYEGGESATDIADAFSVSGTTIYKRLREWGVKIKKSGWRGSSVRINFTDGQKREIINLYENGKTCKEIAKRFDCSTKTIQDRLHKWNVETRKNGEWNRVSIAKAEKKKIINLYLDGQSVHNIAKVVSVCHSTVHKRLKEWGVELRDPAHISMPMTLNIPDKEKGEIISKYKNGHSIAEISEEHNISTRTISSRLQVWEVKNKKRKRSRSKTRKRRKYTISYNLDREMFKIPLSIEEEYWIGILMSDGHIAGTTVSLTSKDIDILKKFRTFSKAEEKPIRDNKDGTYYFSFSYRMAAERLSKYGVIPRKSLIAKAKKGIHESRHYWRGAIDGDGSIGYTSGGYARIGFYSGSRDLVEQYVEFLESNSLYNGNSIHTIRGKYYGFRNCGKHAVTMIKFFYDGTEPYIDRKYEMAQRIISEQKGVM